MSRHLPRLLLVTLAIGGLPAMVLLLFLPLGLLAPLPALLGVAMTLLGAALLALVWVGDLHLLEQTLRVADSASGTPPMPRLPALATLAEGIAQVSRQRAAHVAGIGRRLETDEAIVELLPDPLVVLAADRTVQRVNAAARENFGADLAAVLRHPALRAATDRAQAEGVAQRVALLLPVPARELDAAVIPLLEASGALVVVLSDRTRERAVERMRADFVANASHELRTPLASLIGFIETLRGPAAEDAPAQRRFLGIMAEQAERMNRLIDDLLSLSRIELVEHQAPVETVDLAALVPRVISGLEPRLADQRIALEVRLAAALPVVAGDADQLAQLLLNLLDNAMKYGAMKHDDGAARVRLEARAVSGEARWPARPGLLLSVSDDGPGIPPAHLPRLTERFYRVDTGRSRRAGGTGLGLAIVKHIVNRHRGQLRIESTEGQGSRFTVWLPVARGAEGEEGG
jgi:two-component system phosphate regulon sensor histidine kinase PhoR